MTNNIPTAEEFFIQTQKEKGLWRDYDADSVAADYIQQFAIDFTKLHVEAQAKAISENAQMVGVTQHNNNAPDVHTDFVYVVDSNGPDYGYTVDKNSILNAYPLTNIK